MRSLAAAALKGWLDRLAREVELYAPRLVDGVLLYQPVSSSSEIIFEYTRPKLSAKHTVLPPDETLLSIQKQGRDVSLAEPAVKPQVIFGLRPCDARGIAVLDAVFLGKEPVDVNYARRRAATTLVGLACEEIWPGCFCDRMGSAPDDSAHVDVLLYAVKGRYKVEVVSAKGQALTAEIVKPNTTANSKFQKPKSKTKRVRAFPKPEQWRAHFKSKYWDGLADRCIECRLCAYVCPTCRCFDVRDQLAARGAENERYERLRCWDSCTRANYRTIAGGHNPRPTKGQRLRNRFFCKFHYLPVDYGMSGCVGCGRCVESCPVNIDALQVLDETQSL